MKIGTKIHKYLGQYAKRWISWSAKSKGLKDELEKSPTALKLMKKIELFEKETGKTLKIQHAHDLTEPNEMPSNAKAVFSPKRMRIAFKGELEDLSSIAVAVSEELDHALYNFESPGSLGYDGTEIYKAEKRGKKILHQVREELGVSPYRWAQWDLDTLVNYVKTYRKCSEQEAKEFIAYNLKGLL